jgi:alkylation response protein AidB-like acyl-CoA dehydrogenase
LISSVILAAAGEAGYADFRSENGTGGMDFDVEPSTRTIRDEVRQLLRSDAARRLLRDVAARTDGVDGDVRPLYRLLGQERLLAVSWPEEYGGRGAEFPALVAVAEEMARAGLSQHLYFISVQIVGRLILERGTPAQRHRLLPAMARGDRYACILFTEPDTGSDLGSVASRAARVDGGWLVNGHKKYNYKSSYADDALCAVRTDDTASRYEGLSLILLPLDDPGVSVRPFATIAGEHFHDVHITDVRVDDDAFVGAPGEGWSLISAMFAGERSGLDYYTRGLRWIEAMRATLTPGDPRAAELGRHWARLDASRLLATRVLQRLADGDPDVSEASLSKWHGSVSAQNIAWWVPPAAGLSALTRDWSTGEIFEDAYREAAGMTISGGASEVLLDMVVNAKLVDN